MHIVYASVQESETEFEFETWHRTDTKLPNSGDFNGDKIDPGGHRETENLFLWLGVQAVAKNARKTLHTYMHQHSDIYTEGDISTFKYSPCQKLNLHSRQSLLTMYYLQEN